MKVDLSKWTKNKVMTNPEIWNEYLYVNDAQFCIDLYKYDEDRWQMRIDTGDDWEFAGGFGNTAEEARDNTVKNIRELMSKLLSFLDVDGGI